VDEDFYCRNLEQAVQWRNLIMHAINNTVFFQGNIDYNFLNVPEYKRALLVFVNPHSGSGQAARRWALMEPILEKAGYEITKIDTTHYLHCMEYIQKAPAQDLTKYNGIIAVSGDGLVHEIINGLFTRPDWEAVKDIPVGYLPGGSGNAHLKNICDRAGERCNLESAAYFIAKGKTINMDMTVLELEKKSRVYSFLSVNWSYIADVDLESEFLRCCGGARFEFYGYWRLMALKRYQAKLEYTRTLDLSKMPKLDENIIDTNWDKIDGQFTFLCICNGPYLSEDFNSTPLADYTDGFNDLVTFHGASNTGRVKLAKFLLNAPKGKHVRDGQVVSNTGAKYEKIKAFRLDPQGPTKGIFSIDGERYDAQKLQGWVWEKSLVVFCSR
jgi:diacylglycerol kinase family enzyme